MPDMNEYEQRLAEHVESMNKSVDGMKQEELLPEEKRPAGFDDSALRNSMGNCEICGEREHDAGCPVKAMKDYLEG